MIFDVLTLSNAGDSPDVTAPKAMTQVTTAVIHVVDL